jgi:hypothetical protein
MATLKLIFPPESIAEMREAVQLLDIVGAKITSIQKRGASPKSSPSLANNLSPFYRSIKSKVADVAYALDMIVQEPTSHETN